MFPMIEKSIHPIGKQGGFTYGMNPQKDLCMIQFVYTV